MSSPLPSEIRALLVAGKAPSTQVLRTVLNLAGIDKLAIVDEARRALELLCMEHFDAVFVEGNMRHQGTPFAIKARQLPALVNPLLPIFAIFPGASRRDVETARDLGVTDVICRPLSPRTVMDKLRVALTAPRPFIAAPDFFGPDRRAKTRPLSYVGQERRSRAPRKVRLHMLDS